MKRAVLAGLTGAALLLSVPSYAQSGRDDRPPPRHPEEALRQGAEDAERALREGMDRIMKSLQLMFQSIPQYEMPEMNENGDIIIRRKRPDPEDRTDPREKAPEDSDSTST